jgi:hypothetical protein
MDNIQALNNEGERSDELKKYQELLDCWNNQYKTTKAQLKLIIKRPVEIVNVTHKLNLAKKYLKKKVSCYEKVNCINLLKDNEVKIIGKNKSVIFVCNNRIVGGVVRESANKKVASYFGAKIKAIMEVHPSFNRGKINHADIGEMVAHGQRKNPLDSFVGNYVFKDEKDINSEALKVYVEDGDLIANWIYDQARENLPWITESYEQFKKKVNIRRDGMIGALFCAKNYEANGHSDNDRSDWALGFVYEKGIVKDGHFFYPEYGVTIEMTSNLTWYWLTKAVHGTAIIDLSEGGTRYTTAITLTEKTARAIERTEKMKNQ